MGAGLPTAGLPPGYGVAPHPQALPAPGSQFARAVTGHRTTGSTAPSLSPGMGLPPAASPAPLAEVVMSLPPLTPPGLTMIRAAIARGATFSGTVVLALVEEIEKLHALADAPGVVQPGAAPDAQGPFVASPESSVS